jgi:hypothetical protein
MMESHEKILVVDDEERVRILFKRILLKEGYEVDCAASGSEAIDKLAKDSFDLVVTDEDGRNRWLGFDQKGKDNESSFAVHLDLRLWHGSNSRVGRQGRCRRLPDEAHRHNRSKAGGEKGSSKIGHSYGFAGLSRGHFCRTPSYKSRAARGIGVLQEDREFSGRSFQSKDLLLE